MSKSKRERSRLSLLRLELKGWQDRAADRRYHFDEELSAVILKNINRVKKLIDEETQMR